jgi:hypothetical protein
VTQTPNQVYPCDLAGRKPAFCWSLKKFFKSTSYKQLDNALDPFEIELHNLISRRQEEGQPISPWAENAMKMLECAKTALSLGEVQLGWGYFYKAELLSLHLMDEKMLLDKAKKVLNRSEERLEDWEKKTVRDLIGQAVQGGAWSVREGVRVDEVYSALETIQQHYIDAYTNLDTAMFQLRILATISVVLSLFIIWSLMNYSGQVVANNVFLLLSSVLFGGIGGSVSGIITVANNSRKGDTPTQLLSSWITIIRPIVGAAAALAISMFLLSGIVNLGDVTNNLIFAVSFAAGFSERVLISAVDKVS